MRLYLENTFSVVFFLFYSDKCNVIKSARNNVISDDVTLTFDRRKDEKGEKKKLVLKVTIVILLSIIRNDIRVVRPL